MSDTIDHSGIVTVDGILELRPYAPTAHGYTVHRKADGARLQYCGNLEMALNYARAKIQEGVRA